MALLRNKFNIGELVSIVSEEGQQYKILHSLRDDTNDTFVYFLDSRGWTEEKKLERAD
jgi:hypothetical protein